MKKAKITIKSIYSDIREILFSMIPEKWESIYLYASVIEDKHHHENGEMFFFYYPQSIIKKNPVNVYEVPVKFNINEQDYLKVAMQLYGKIKELWKMCQQIDNILWTNITISIENVEFLAEYNLDDLVNSPYTADDRRLIWKYKYLNYPIERMSKKERNVLERYLNEEEWGGHATTIYSETFYQKHIHNNIKYNEEQDDQEDQENVRQEVQERPHYDNKNMNKVQKNQEAQIESGNIKNQLLKFNK